MKLVPLAYIAVDIWFANLNPREYFWEEPIREN